LTLGVDVELGGRCGRLANPVVGDALDAVVVVSGRLDRLDAQHRPVRHVERRITLTAGRHASSALPPVDFRCRVAGRLAEEADDAVVRHSLVTWCYRHLGRVCNATLDHTRRCQSYAIHSRYQRSGIAPSDNDRLVSRDVCRPDENVA